MERVAEEEETYYNTLRLDQSMWRKKNKTKQTNEERKKKKRMTEKIIRGTNKWVIKKE